MGRLLKMFFSTKPTDEVWIIETLMLERTWALFMGSRGGTNGSKQEARKYIR
jgi:hypothetical protein